MGVITENFPPLKSLTNKIIKRKLALPLSIEQSILLMSFIVPVVPFMKPFKEQQCLCVEMEAFAYSLMRKP